MRISSKGRYGLAAAVTMARSYAGGATKTVAGLSEQLGVSKIYLEQVFSLLKKAGVVRSFKGTQGGYRLARPPEKITALEVLTALEQSLFEKTERSVSQKAPDVENAMQSAVFTPTDEAVAGVLSRVTLDSLAAKANTFSSAEAYMYYI